MPDANGRPYLSEKIDGVSIVGGATVGSDGGYGIRRAALTGSVTAAAGSNTTAIAAAALSALEALTPAADRISYYTSSSAAALATLTSYARTLLDDATASDAQTTLGISTFVKTLIDDATAAAFMTTLGISAYAQTLLDDANAAAAQTTLGISAYAQTLLDDANAAAAQTTLGISAFVQTILDGANAAAVQTTLGISSFIQTLLDDTTAAAARTTLGFADGTWTPTTVNVTNAAASTGYEGQYARIGNTVVFSVTVDATPTVGESACVIGIPLPIASNFANAYDAAGCGVHAGDGVCSAVYADAANDRLEMSWTQSVSSARTFRISGCYQVI